MTCIIYLQKLKKNNKINFSSSITASSLNIYKNEIKHNSFGARQVHTYNLYLHNKHVSALLDTSRIKILKYIIYLILIS